MSEPRRAEVCIDVGVGETLHLDVPAARRLDSERIAITLLYKSGLKARFRVEADTQVSIQKTRVAQTVLG